MYTTQTSTSKQRLLKIHLIFIRLYHTKPISADNVGVNVVRESINVGDNFKQKLQLWDLNSCIWVPIKKPILSGLKYDKLTNISIVLNYPI